jgi:hypothetical protein
MTIAEDHLRIDETLGCQVESVRYIALERRGVLHVPSGQCGDMGATMALFQRIDPDVEVIETWAGGRPDAVHRRFAGRWVCVELSRD